MGQAHGIRESSDYIRAYSIVEIPLDPSFRSIVREGGAEIRATGFPLHRVRVPITTDGTDGVCKDQRNSGRHREDVLR